jgi:hypothetical protein
MKIRREVVYSLLNSAVAHSQVHGFGDRTSNRHNPNLSRNSGAPGIVPVNVNLRSYVLLVTYRRPLQEARSAMLMRKSVTFLWTSVLWYQPRVRSRHRLNQCTAPLTLLIPNSSLQFLVVSRIVLRNL